MPLRLTIMPFETFHINGAIITNGASKADLYLNNQCRMLRGSEMVEEAEASTPGKRIAFLVQQIHLKEESFSEMSELSRLAVDLVTTLPGAAAHLAKIHASLAEKRTHTAFKQAKALAAHEAEWLSKSDSFVQVAACA